MASSSSEPSSSKQKINLRSVLYRVDFTNEALGKLVASSKRKLVWRFGFANPGALQDGLTGSDCRGEEHEIVVTYSTGTGKRAIIHNNEEIFSAGLVRNDGKFHHTWNMKRGGHSIQILAYFEPPYSLKKRQFELFIDGLSFFTFNKIFELGTRPISPPPLTATIKMPKSHFRYEDELEQGNEEHHPRPSSPTQPDEGRSVGKPEAQSTTVAIQASSAPAVAPTFDLLGGDSPEAFGSVPPSVTTQDLIDTAPPTTLDLFTPVPTGAPTYEAVSNQILTTYDTTRSNTAAGNYYDSSSYNNNNTYYSNNNYYENNSSTEQYTGAMVPVAPSTNQNYYNSHNYSTGDYAPQQALVPKSNNVYDNQFQGNYYSSPSGSVYDPQPTATQPGYYNNNGGNYNNPYYNNNSNTNNNNYFVEPNSNAFCADQAPPPPQQQELSKVPYLQQYNGDVSPTSTLDVVTVESLSLKDSITTEETNVSGFDSVIRNLVNFDDITVTVESPDKKKGTGNDKKSSKPLPPAVGYLGNGATLNDVKAIKSGTAPQKEVMRVHQVPPSMAQQQQGYGYNGLYYPNHQQQQPQQQYYHYQQPQQATNFINY